MSSKRVLALTLLVLFTAHAHALAQDESAHPAAFDSATVARKLSSRNPVERRAAAEELARTAAAEHRRLAEGYRAQERDARARLALDWALYRMGKNEALFGVVSELDSKKNAEQAVGYLKQIESPEPLYVFLGRVNGNTLIRVLEVLAAVGDTATLERIKPYAESLDPGISDAAKFAEQEINLRLQEPTAVEPKRQRKVGRTAGEGQP
ncbi:MAG TPA: hypothetical protein VKB12_21540 [Pyrinomonadaceae bacterium]|nr:hypothetical protein [Pyrinomonadaceae bacterium]